MDTLHSGREIKFRAWNKTKAHFEYLTLLRGGNVSATDIPMKGEKVKEWQQFTGLKDKNGKEIYDGDIVENTHLGSGEYDVIKFEDCWFFAEGVDSKKHKGIGADKVEVIGNIYENPELIN